MQILRILGPVLVTVALASTAGANDFDIYGAAPTELVPPRPTAGFIVEVGLGVDARPAYEGASDYTAAFSPIIEIKRLTIPGLIDINDSDPLSIAPSFEIISERKGADHEWLLGLNDVGATYIVGARVGYEMPLWADVSAEVFGKLQYAFGGAEGFLGGVGANLFWHLTPQLTVTAGSELSFAGEDYMNTYFGVTPGESAATGGRLAAYDPEAGLKSADLNLSAKYEVLTDTFVTVRASYRQLLGSAADSPVVEQDGQFIVGIGLSRRFSAGY